MSNEELQTISSRQAPSGSVLFVSTLEKKGALGLWSKKDVELDPVTLDFKVSEKEKILFSGVLRSVASANGEDAGAVVFSTSDGTSITLRGSTQRQSGEWYLLCSSILEEKGIGRYRMFGLPREDPRFKLPFLPHIPLDHLIRFTKLDGSVVYYFDQVKKYELTSLVSRKPSLQDRLVFATDRCLYVTRMDSSLTHCIKIERITQVFTNVYLTQQKTPPFVVLKYPEQDVHVQTATAKRLLEVLNLVYTYRHNDIKKLDIRPVDDALDGAIKLKLEESEMKMVLPTTKASLKKALDQFATEHGVSFVTEEDSGASLNASPMPSRIPSFADHRMKSMSNLKSPQGPTGAPAPAPPLQLQQSAGPLDSASSPLRKDVQSSKDLKRTMSKLEAIPKNDPLGWFLIDCDLPHLYHQFRRQAVDLDVLELMDANDLQGFGLTDADAVATIREHVLFPGFLEDARGHAEAEQKGELWDKPKRVIPRVSPSREDDEQTHQFDAALTLNSGGDTEEPPLQHSRHRDSDDSHLMLSNSVGSTNVLTPHSHLGERLHSDDDEDSDFDLPPPSSTAASPPQSNKQIILDSDPEDNSDDDIKLPLVNTITRPRIVLDDDDDI